MKTKERHHLKANEFVSTTARVVETVTEHRDRIMMGAIVLAVVLIAGGGYWYWRHSTAQQAGSLLGIAMAMEQAPIVPAPSLPGSTQNPGTFPTEQARLEATLAAFQKVAESYASMQEGLTAQYHVGVTLLTMGRYDEADRAFQTTADRAGSSVYGPMARMGRAEVLLRQAKYDAAIKAFSDLSGERDGLLPIDGVLMQLARAYMKAGKIQDARATFKRVVDEFPQSPFASDARQQMTLIG
jgi:TolA-binding protein